MKKILFAIGVVAIISLGIYLVLNIPPKINTPSEKINTSSEKILIVTTLFPQYDFTKAIGGDKVEVTLLLPPGAEAHSFELKPSDITKINNAKIFVYTGEFMEPWANDIIKNGDKKVKIVDASRGVELMKKEENTEDEHEEEHKHEEAHYHHHHGGVDPHIWLDFDNAKIITENIAKALIEVDPQNADYYQNNLKVYQSKLTELDNAYRKTLSICKLKTIIHAGHYTFGYMAKRYGLKYIAAQGVSPDAEPTAKDLIALTEQIKKDNIKFIFYEELVSPKIAETLSKETNAKLLFLHAAHNLSKKDYESGATFISLMEQNLQNFSLGLDCQR